MANFMGKFVVFAAGIVVGVFLIRPGSAQQSLGAPVVRSNLRKVE